MCPCACPCENRGRPLVNFYSSVTFNDGSFGRSAPTPKPRLLGEDQRQPRQRAWRCRATVAQYRRRPGAHALAAPASDRFATAAAANEVACPEPGSPGDRNAAWRAARHHRQAEQPPAASCFEPLGVTALSAAWSTRPLSPIASRRSQAGTRRATSRRIPGPQAHTNGTAERGDSP